MSPLRGVSCLAFPLGRTTVRVMNSEPQLFDVTLILPQVERTIRVTSDTHIWDAALAAGIDLPALCHQGYCLTCAGKIESENCRQEVDQSDSLVYYPQDHQAGYVLLCTVKPRSPLRIRTHQQNEMRRFRKRNGLPAPYSWTED